MGQWDLVLTNWAGLKEPLGACLSVYPPQCWDYNQAAAPGFWNQEIKLRSSGFTIAPFPPVLLLRGFIAWIHAPGTLLTLPSAVAEGARQDTLPVMRSCSASLLVPEVEPMTQHRSQHKTKCEGPEA